MVNTELTEDKVTSQAAEPEEEGEIQDDQAKQVVREGTVRKEMKRVRDEYANPAVYVPPAKRRQLLDQKPEEVDSTAAAMKLQSEGWNSQRRVIHGTINRLNSGTIKPLIQELFQKVNLVRLRGVLCKSIMSAAMSSPKYSNVYAALIAVINSKLPEVGELAVARSVLDFRRYFKHREKDACQSVCMFLAHLFHQAVVHELLILQILSVLLDGDPTDDSVEVAIQLMQTSGQALLEVSPAGVRGCVERLRALLHEGQLNKRVEYKMEKLLKIRKGGFKDFPPIDDELDLVERDDQITHEVTLDDEEISREENLDVFSFDEAYDENEKEWTGIRGEILGEGGSSSDEDDDSDEDSDESSDESEASEIPDQELAVVPASEGGKETTVVQDLTEQDLVHLRRTIYLTIMSSATFEECAHKLARIDVPTGREMELINMLIECCSQERTFLRYYALIAARFCLLDDRWRDAFMVSFSEQYTTIHRLETNKLRNVAKLFAHLLHSDSMPWSVLEVIHLNEDETTSSSRIFVKIVIQEMAEAVGIQKLKKRFETEDEEMKVWYGGMFPKDNVRNTRYAVNFFTSIGLGPLTDDLRDFLKNAPKLILAKAKEAALAKQGSDSDDSSSVSSSSSSSSSSYTSSSTYTSSSSSSRSSSSGSYSRRRNSSRRRRRRSSSRSYSSSSTGSSSDSQDSRRRRRDAKPKRRSPPSKVIVKRSSGDGMPQTDPDRQGSRRGDESRSGQDNGQASPRPDSPSPNRKHRRQRSRSYSSSSGRQRKRDDDGKEKKSSRKDDKPPSSIRRRRRRSRSYSSSSGRSRGQKEGEKEKAPPRAAKLSSSRKHRRNRSPSHSSSSKSSYSERSGQRKRDGEGERSRSNGDRKSGSRKENDAGSDGRKRGYSGGGEKAREGDRRRGSSVSRSSSRSSSRG